MYRAAARGGHSGPARVVNRAAAVVALPPPVDELPPLVDELPSEKEKAAAHSRGPAGGAQRP